MNDNIKSIIVTFFIISMFSVISANNAIGEQSCCGYTMPSGVYNPFSCYSIGNCVWWAVYKRNDLNFMIHSPDSATYPDYWVNTAKSKGYDVGTTPKKGAIAVYKRSSAWGSYGHVAYVESVSGNQYTVTEMGYNAWYCVRTRTRTAGIYNEKYIYESGSNGKPDIRVSELNVNKINQSSTNTLKVQPGEEFEVHVWISNKGDSDVNDKFYIKYLISTDDNFTENDSSIGGDSISSIDIGERNHEDVKININETGTYYIGVWADNKDDIDETDESNNFSDSGDEIAMIIVAESNLPECEDEYLVGDWDGDGRDNLAVRRGNYIYMDTNFDGGGDLSTQYGLGNDEDQYLVGDWDGDGKDEFAVRRNNWIYRYGQPLIQWGLGNEEDQYFVGDWNGDGKDEFGLRRGNWLYRYGQPEIQWGLGNEEDEYFVADWNGDGIDEFGIRRNNYILQYNGPTIQWGLGNNEDEYLFGDWNGDGIDDFAVRRDNLIIMRNIRDQYYGNGADSDFCRTPSGDIPPLECTFSAYPTKGIEPLTVTFKNNIIGNNSFEWDFGDNSNSTEVNPTHTYNLAGSYIVTLNSYDQDGNLLTPQSIHIEVLSSQFNLGDAIVIIKMLSGINDTNIDFSENLDYNDNNKIGLEDALFILRKIAGM